MRIGVLASGSGTILQAFLDANLPVVVVGKGGGTFRTGQYLKCRQETPMSNLLLAMLQQAGVPVDRFGDSTEPLPGLLS